MVVKITNLFYYPNKVLITPSGGMKRGFKKKKKVGKYLPTYNSCILEYSLIEIESVFYICKCGLPSILVFINVKTYTYVVYNTIQVCSSVIQISRYIK